MNSNYKASEEVSVQHISKLSYKLTKYHRQRGSDCTVLTATGLVNGEWQILTPYRIETLEPIDKKFGTRDYVRETTPYAKFGANPSKGGFWANR